MPFERVPVDSRLVMEALKVTNGAEPHQVAVPRLIFGQQNQVMNRLVLPASPFLARACRKIHLAADDRLDVVLFTQFIKRNRAVHDPVIRQRQRLHAGGCGLGNEVLEPGGPVQQAVFTMYVQMNKAVHAIPTFRINFTKLSQIRFNRRLLNYLY
ncbi:hypothetical protein D3C74_276720 [compost metagenome]